MDIWNFFEKNKFDIENCLRNFNKIGNLIRKLYLSEMILPELDVPRTMKNEICESYETQENSEMRFSFFNNANINLYTQNNVSGELSS